MRTIEEIKGLLEMSTKDMEKAVDMVIRNGQGRLGIKKALLWVLDS